jgi:hypothetical protein
MPSFVHVSLWKAVVSKRLRLVDVIGDGELTTLCRFIALIGKRSAANGQPRFSMTVTVTRHPVVSTMPSSPMNCCALLKRPDGLEV